MLILSKHELIQDLTNNLKGTMKAYAVKKFTSLSDDDFIKFVSKDLSLSIIAPGRFQIHVKSLSDNTLNPFEKTKIVENQGTYKKIFE